MYVVFEHVACRISIFYVIERNGDLFKCVTTINAYLEKECSKLKYAHSLILCVIMRLDATASKF